MDDFSPAQIAPIMAATVGMGFQLFSDPLTGSLLRTLAASKPRGNFLELGTGTGLATAWLLSGMDAHSALTTVENDSSVLAVAQTHLGDDPRLLIRCQDAGQFLSNLDPATCQFDLIFADTWAGKYTHLDAALAVLKVGGFYLIDDMLPQPTWPLGHAPKVAELMAHLAQRQDLHVTRLDWASGIIIAAKVAPKPEHEEVAHCPFCP
ncbi:class I SAM-dependent methyltransferase [Thermosynechococcaceae cyanobacterium Okahandja]